MNSDEPQNSANLTEKKKAAISFDSNDILQDSWLNHEKYE